MRHPKLPGGRHATGQKLLLSLLAGASVLSVSVGAAGQTVVPASGKQPSGAMETPEVVVVTAQKRSEKLLSVPASVTALTAAQLGRTEAVTMADYAALAPGLDLVSAREGQTQLVMRGITTGSTTPNTTVAIYLDDSPYGSSTVFAGGNQLTLDLDPSDLQQIEVLRGPQGTLYGASSLGGVLKYVTTPPDLENYETRLEVDGSTVDGGGNGYGFRGMANIPLVDDTLGFRISAFDRLDPGYIDNPQLHRTDVNQSRVYGGRASVLWQPIARLSVRLTALHQDLDSGGTSEEDVDGTTLKPLYGDLVQRRYANEPLNIQYWLTSGVVNYDLGWASLVSATSYATLHESQINDLTDTYQPVLGPALHIPDLGIAFDIPINQTKVTQEFRIVSASEDRLEWQGGVFFTHEQSTHGEVFEPFLTTTGTSIPVNLLSGALLSHYTEYAGYGDLTYHFTSQFDVLAGGRYSSNSQNYSQPESGALIGPSTTLVAKSSDDSGTFMVSPRYRFDDDNMAYIRIASGYRPGGPNPLTPAEAAGGVPASFAPDTLTNYEVGYKAALLEQKLTLDLSAFYIDWRNIQIQTVFNGFDATGNGGTAQSAGVEAAATYAPIQGLNLTANLDYTEAELTQNAPGVSARSGEELPDVPRFAGYISADYDFPVLASWNGFVGGDVRYVGDRTSGFVTGAPAGFERPVMPDYTTVGLRAGVSHDAWKFELYAKNLSDARGMTSLSSLSFSGYSNPYEASIIAPRTVGFSLSVEY
jgi:outer membrane receptor protein involved in Fe transport